MREARLAQLAEKYRAETRDFEEEERRVREEVALQANLKPETWLKDSIRQSVAEWKSGKKPQVGSNPSNDNFRGISDGQRLLNEELNAN